MRARMDPSAPSSGASRGRCATSRQPGKSARLVIEGEDVELDAKVIELLRDPLTHLVRNALSHGVEAPSERAARGKDPCGVVRLGAVREAGGIVIEVSDDGAGLSRERIVERARAMGLLGELGDPGDAELQRLIFEPGFTTAASVSEVSGRGVGLDVVERNVEALRGSVSVVSRPGAGTTFTIRLPLSLAIVPGFAVSVGAETYILPLESVLECLELDREAHAGPDGSGVMSLRGEPLPYRRLRLQFRVGGAPPPREFVVVLEHAGRRIGVVVDALLGDSQTVLKPLGRIFRDVPGLAGSAILGSGRVALILDVHDLFREPAA